jgi:hypothetical protein
MRSAPIYTDFMGLKRFFFLTFSLFLILWGFLGHTVEGGSSPRVQQIDQQIQELQDMKRGYEARALRHENQAEYLQFDDQTYLETRRHNQLAEENRAKAAAVQEQIDKLQAEKKKLQQGKTP